MADTIPIWPDTVPIRNENDPEVPCLRPFVPDSPDGSAVIVCPGGGYRGRVDWEKEPVAAWLNARGITAFVCEYRVGPHNRFPVPLLDVAESVRIVRAGASRWSLDPNRVGIIGFSAGGHAAAGACVFIDPPELEPHTSHPDTTSRPDYATLVYPVITMDGRFTNRGSRDNLLGPDPSPDLCRRTSLDLQVSDRTPPTLFIHAMDDTSVPCENSLLMAMAMRANRVPVELHVYDKSGHGFGLRSQDEVLRTWTDRMADWLAQRGVGRRPG